MDYNVVIIRFGEMNTKGKNKKDFINTLARSIKEALLDYKDLIEYSVRHDHIYLYLKSFLLLLPIHLVIQYLY